VRWLIMDAVTFAVCRCIEEHPGDAVLVISIHLLKHVHALGARP
jgi:hypothetical protein